MRISDIGKMAKAEANGNFELKAWLIEQQHRRDDERRWQIERDLRNGVGEDYDVPEQLNKVLLTRVFNLLNGLWNMEGYGQLTSEVSTGRGSKKAPRPMYDNLRGIRSSKTLKIPGVGKPLVMDKWDGYFVYDSGQRDEYTTRLALRSPLGSFALVGDGKGLYSIPDITQSPRQDQLSGLGRTATYQRDIETLGDIYTAFGEDHLTVINKEPLIEPV